jgi:GH15 family glucan-1,4-alpha-glucosidase
MADLGLAGRVQQWRAARDQIHAEVCEQGYDAHRGTFTQYYGSSELDAAVLMIPEVGFLPADDPRVISTVETIQRELVRDGLVLRYTQPAAKAGGQANVDGLPGGEGAFLACSFWLANALQMIGRPAEAEQLFDRLLTLRNDLGLLSEEYDPRYSRQVGNVPQAFSHVPLIQTALNLDSPHPYSGRRSSPRAAAAQAKIAGP